MLSLYVAKFISVGKVFIELNMHAFCGKNLCFSKWVAAMLIELYMGNVELFTWATWSL